MRSQQSDASGFVMAVLIVVMGIGALWMTVSLPAWKQQSTREKEEELLFRLTQYGRAFQLYQRKNGPGTTPPNIDALVDGKFLRKKYKDPTNGEDFLPVVAGAPTAPGQGAQPAPGVQPGRAGQPGQAGQNAQAPTQGVITGVRSKNTKTSIKVVGGRTTYDQWQPVPPPSLGRQGGPNAPGGPGGGVPTGGPGRGGQPVGPGGIGPGISGPGRGVPAGPGLPTGPGRGGAPGGGVPVGPGRGRGGL